MIALFERVILRQKTVFLGPLKSSKNMLRKSILIGLFVLNNNRTKISSGRVGKAIVLTCFFMAGYGRHRKLEVGFRTAGYGQHRSQWVKQSCQLLYCHITICFAVSIKHRLQTTDYGLGIKHGLGIKRGLSITDWV